MRLVGMDPKKLSELLKERFGDKVQILSIEPKRLFFKIDYELAHDAARFLKENGFDMAITMGGTDFPKKNVIEIFYGVWSSVHDFVTVMKFDISREEPRFKTFIDIWPAVHNYERETWELLGVEIEGHPRLKLLLLPDDWSFEEEGHPLRKDFDATKYRSPWGDER